MEKEIRVKGTAFKSVLLAVESLRGKTFADAVRAELSGDLGEAIRFGGVISSGWYPVAWFRELYGTIVRLSGDPEFARHVGAESTRNDAGTVLRVFLRMLTVPFLLSQGGRVFRMFFDAGDVKITETESKCARVRWTGCDGFDRNVWLEQLGATEALLVLHGGRAQSMRVLAGGNDGDSLMDLEVRWS